MALDISKRVDDIRQKPEHIRMRYAIGLALICMTFIGFIWFLTVKQNFSSFSSPETRRQLEGAQGTFEQAEKTYKEEAKSLKDFSADQGITVDTNQQKTEEFVEQEINKGTKPVLGIPSFSE